MPTGMCTFDNQVAADAKAVYRVGMARQLLASGYVLGQVYIQPQ